MPASVGECLERAAMRTLIQRSADPADGEAKLQQLAAHIAGRLGVSHVEHRFVVSVAAEVIDGRQRMETLRDTLLAFERRTHGPNPIPVRNPVGLFRRMWERRIGQRVITRDGTTRRVGRSA